MTRGTADEARLARTRPRATNRCVATRTVATRSRMRTTRPPLQPSKPRQAAFDSGFRQRLSTAPFDSAFRQRLSTAPFNEASRPPISSRKELGRHPDRDRETRPRSRQRDGLRRRTRPAPDRRPGRGDRARRPGHVRHQAPAQGRRRQPLKAGSRPGAQAQVQAQVYTLARPRPTCHHVRATRIGSRRLTEEQRTWHSRPPSTPR